MKTLPEFGKYPVQIVSFQHENPAHPFHIMLGEYADDHLSIPEDTLKALKREIGDTSAPPFEALSNNGLALIKSSGGYIPVGVYESSTKTLLPFEEIPGIEPLIKQQEAKTLTGIKKTQEQFYVLENEYQQLVFSNRGAALAEINLPFKNPKSDTESVVREIDFDREMVKDIRKRPFSIPSLFYSREKRRRNGEHKEGALGGYYPLLRRDLIEPAGMKSIKVAPRYYALISVSEYPELAELIFEVKHFDEKSIVFEANQSHRRITKTYSIEEEEKRGSLCSKSHNQYRRRRQGPLADFRHPRSGMDFRRTGTRP